MLVFTYCQHNTRKRTMWATKRFKTSHAMANWIGANQHRFQIVPLYVNNGYAVEFKKLRRVY